MSASPVHEGERGVDHVSPHFERILFHPEKKAGVATTLGTQQEDKRCTTCGRGHFVLETNFFTQNSNVYTFTLTRSWPSCAGDTSMTKIALTIHHEVCADGPPPGLRLQFTTTSALIVHHKVCTDDLPQRL